MFVYWDDKLFVLQNNTLIGVEIYPDNVVLVKGTEIPYTGQGRVVTSREVKAKWNILAGGSYIFPKPKVIEPPKEIEVVKIDPIREVKRTAGRPKRK